MTSQRGTGFKLGPPWTPPRVTGLTEPESRDGVFSSEAKAPSVGGGLSRLHGTAVRDRENDHGDLGRLPRPRPHPKPALASPQTPARLRQDSVTTRAVFAGCSVPDTALDTTGHREPTFARTEHIFRGVKGGQRFAASRGHRKPASLGSPSPPGPCPATTPSAPCCPRSQTFALALPLRPQMLIPLPSSGSLLLPGVSAWWHFH